MSKQHIVEQIRELNRTAPQEYLITFNERALQEYLQRLSLPRGRGGICVRRNDHSAVATRPPRPLGRVD